MFTFINLKEISHKREATSLNFKQKKTQITYKKLVIIV